RAVPGRLLERVRGHVLGAVVQRASDLVALVGHRRPIPCPDVVGPAAEQKPAGGLEQRAQVVAVLGHERAGPPAVLEPTIAVLAGVSWSLDHTVERGVFDYGNPAHCLSPAVVKFVRPVSRTPGRVREVRASAQTSSGRTVDRASGLCSTAITRSATRSAAR